jgi:hypothetical protein
MEDSKLRDGTDLETRLLVDASRRLCSEAGRLCACGGALQQEIHEVIASARNTVHVATLRRHLVRRLGRLARERSERSPM